MPLRGYRSWGPPKEIVVSLSETVLGPSGSDELSTVKSIGPAVLETDMPASILVRRPPSPRLPLVLGPVPLMVTGPPLDDTKTLRLPLLVTLTGAVEDLV